MAGLDQGGTAQDRRVVFLLDAASGLERRVLERWIGESRANGRAAEAIPIPPSRKRAP